MKKSYSLLITLLLITIFSFLGVFIIEIKSMEIDNKNNLYLSSQNKLYLDFFKSYIKSLDLKTNCFKNIEIIDDIYKLTANINYEKSCTDSNNKATIDIFVNTKIRLNSINLHEKFILKL